MNNRNIAYMQMLSQYGSITQASEKLFITPSALSKYISKLEAEIGTPLFNRFGNRFVLTYAGERYLDWCTRIEVLSSGMRSEMDDLVAKRSGKLRVGIQSSLSDLFTDKILPRFQKYYPDICVALFEENATDAEKLLEHFKLDLMISAHYIDSEIYRQEELVPMEPVLLVPSEHPLAARAVKRKEYPYPWIDLSWCAGERFIVMHAQQEPRKLMEKYMGPVFDSIIKTAEVRTTRTMIHAVENRLGIIQTADCLADIYCKEFTDLVKLSIGPVHHEPMYEWLCFHKDLFISQPLECFMKICHEEFRRLKQGNRHIS